MFRRSLLNIYLVFGVVFLAPASVLGQGWGTLSGTVSWKGEIPKPRPNNVNIDQSHCLQNGPILSETLVINPKNRGVQWVVVWLLDGKNPKNDLPVHPELRALKIKEVVVDQPCCKFEPHVLALREGQVLVAKNSSPVAHNVSLTSVGKGPNLNQMIPASQKLSIDGWFAARNATKMACSIHPWMDGYVWTFNHPYFAVTDANGTFTLKNAPAGDYNLVVWQEEVGLGKLGRAGMPVTIPAGGVSEVKVEMKAEK